MVGLAVVITTCALTSAAGLAAAALMARRRPARTIGPRFVSFAVGVLLGAVLLDLLPGLWQATGSLAALLGLLAAALLVSRLFDRLCACDHARCPGTGTPSTHRTHHTHRVRGTRGTRACERAERSCCWPATSCTA